MAPTVLRRFLAAGVVALATATSVMAADKPATPAPVVEPDPTTAIKPMPGPDATHAEFVAWLRTTDLGKMLRRDESAYTVERTKNGSIMRLNGPAFREVLVMSINTKTEGEVLPVCINTEAQAEQVLTGKSETKKQ